MLLLIPVLIVLFVLSAFFSASETILFSLTPLQRKRIAARNPAAAAKIERWTGDSAGILSTILAGNTLVNFALASCGYLFLEWMIPRYAEAVSVPLFTLLLLTFGEITPKQYAMRNAEQLAPGCVKALSFWSVVLRPISRFMSVGTRVFGNLLSRERRALSDDELRAIVDAMPAAGVLDAEEASMVDGVLRLPDLYALNEMTPRVHIEGIEDSMSPEEKLRIAMASRYPYIPVYRKTPDSIIGVLDVRKLVLDPLHDVASAISEPLRVREYTGLDDLLVLFRRTGRRIAVVEDRWGGTAGIITRGDILELITKPVEEEGEVRT